MQKSVRFLKHENSKSSSADAGKRTMICFVLDRFVLQTVVRQAVMKEGQRKGNRRDEQREAS